MVSASKFLEDNKSQQGSTRCDGLSWCSCCYVIWVPASQGKYEDAELLYRRAMEIAGATLGEAHPDYYVKLNNLAWLLKRQVKAIVYRCNLGMSLDAIRMLPPCCSI